MDRRQSSWYASRCLGGDSWASHCSTCVDAHRFVRERRAPSVFKVKLPTKCAASIRDSYNEENPSFASGRFCGGRDAHVLCAVAQKLRGRLRSPRGGGVVSAEGGTTRKRSPGRCCRVCKIR